MKLVWNKLEFWKQDLVKRAAWTFGQAFIASFIVLAPGILAAPNLATVRALGISALLASVAAGLSALKGLLLAYKPY